MSLNINQVKEVIQRFNKISSSKDLVKLDEDRVGDGSDGKHICHLYYHKEYSIYVIATIKDDKLYVEPPFTAYHPDPYLAQRGLENLVLNNVSITEFLESGKYENLKSYILEPSVYNDYRRMKNLMYEFDGNLDHFYRTDKKLEADINPPKDSGHEGLEDRIIKTMEIHNLK